VIDKKEGMNTILDWLSGGDLRSDGATDQAAETVLQHPELIDDLIEGLDSIDDVVRGRTADTLEKVSRKRPDMVIKYLPKMLSLLKEDAVPMVRMHLAMMLGHLAGYTEHAGTIVPELLRTLDDARVFTKSWVIVSLCIYARKYPRYHKEITQRIATLSSDPSTAIRTRVRYAMEILSDEKSPFPKGWVKSERVFTE